LNVTVVPPNLTIVIGFSIYFVLPWDAVWTAPHSQYKLGATDGMTLGATDGVDDGRILGTVLGDEVGTMLGDKLGCTLGKLLGTDEGLNDGTSAHSQGTINSYDTLFPTSLDCPQIAGTFTSSVVAKLSS
jgi:hypothetical protein